MTQEQKKTDLGLPHGWERVTLDKLGDVLCGQSPTSAAVNSDGAGTAYVSGPEHWDGFKLHLNKWTTDPRRVVPDGCVFITVKGAGVGKIFPGTACAIGRDIYAFKPHKGIPERFVELALKNTVQEIIGNAKGDIPGLSKAHLTDHQIAIPGTGEQERIVSKVQEFFSDLDKGEENLRRVQALIGRYRQSVLKAAVTGELTRDWREKNKDSIETGEQLLKRILKARREAWEKAELAKMHDKGQKPKNDKWKEKYKEPAGPDTSELSELPEGWVWASLEQLTSLITSGSRGWAKYYSETGATFIRAQDIKTDKLVTKDIAYVSLPEGVEGTRTRVSKEDILITITGANVTKTALVQEEIEEAYVSQHVALARPVDNDLADYLFNWIICPTHGRRELEKKAYGAGKPGLSLENLRELAVALPPKEEQQEVLSEIDRVLTTIAGSDKDIATYSIASTALRQSILKAAFSGQLVPQDPNDEPASELLKRIAEEKAKTEDAKPKQGGTKKKAVPKGKKTPSKLAEARKKAGLTQAKLAKAAGINPAYISQMENGRRAITPEQAEKLAEVLGVTAQSLQ